MIKIEDFSGRGLVEDSGTLRTYFARRYDNDLNEYWLSTESGFPALSIQVRGSLACLHYFPSADHPGYISKNKGGNISVGEIVVFATNTPEEEIEVYGENIVGIEEAFLAANEFVVDPFRLPPSTRWIEL